MLSDDARRELIRDAETAPRTHEVDPSVVFHFSEDGSIRRFAPHVPPSNPSQPPSVWAIDGTHAPLYWFPRNCPRISVWAHDEQQQRVLSERFETEASRVCAAESGWLGRIATARIYRYSFDGVAFRPWDDADGQFIATDAVYPVEVEPLDDLLGLHADAGIELRFTPRLGTLMDAILQSGLPFSFVRIRDAQR